jgi:hypothetical protein
VLFTSSSLVLKTDQRKSWKQPSNCRRNYFVLSFKTSHPQTGSLTGSPHLSELSINSQGGAAPANVTLSPNLSPDNKQASPLISPLLNDQACPRTDDEEEGRRKVQICGKEGV